MNRVSSSTGQSQVQPPSLVEKNKKKIKILNWASQGIWQKILSIFEIDKAPVLNENTWFSQSCHKFSKCTYSTLLNSSQFLWRGSLKTRALDRMQPPFLKWTCTTLHRRTCSNVYGCGYYIYTSTRTNYCKMRFCDESFIAKCDFIDFLSELWKILP